MDYIFHRYHQLSLYGKVIFLLCLALVAINLVLIFLFPPPFKQIFGLSGMTGLITIVLILITKRKF